MHSEVLKQGYMYVNSLNEHDFNSDHTISCLLFDAIILIHIIGTCIYKRGFRIPTL